MSDQGDKSGAAGMAGSGGVPPPPRVADRIEPAATGRRRRAVISLAGAVLLLLGLFMAWGGIAPLTESRDADGYYLSDPVSIDRRSFAVVATDMDLLRGRWETLAEESFVEMFLSDPDEVRIQVEASEADGVFVGVAPSAEVDRYLDGVTHDEIAEWDADRNVIFEVEYTTHDGTTEPGPPDGETFWVASVSGTGSQTLDWRIQSGDWTTVVMNADASRGVTAEVTFGARPPSGWDPLHWVSFAVGLVLVAVGGLLLFRGTRT